MDLKKGMNVNDGEEKEKQNLMLARWIS